MASSRMMLMMTAAVVGCVSVFAPNPVLAQAGGTTMTITVTGWGEGAAAATADKNAYVAYQEAGIYIYQTLGLCTVTKTVVTDGPAQMFGRGAYWFHDFEATYDISWTAPWGPGGGGAGGGDPGDGSEDPGDGSEGPDDGGPEPGDGSEDQGSSDDEEYDEEYYEQGYYE